MQLEDLPGLGATSIADLKSLGVHTPEELVFHFPFRYEDFSAKASIASLQGGEAVTIHGTIEKIVSRRIPGRRLILIEARVTDDTGELTVTWFNQPYLLQTLPPGCEVALSGEVKRMGKKLVMTHPTYERVRRADLVHTGRVVPIYSLTGSLTQKRLRAAIAHVLRTQHETEWMPKEILEREHLVSFHEALQELHFPSGEEALDVARRRLQFDELFLYELSQFLARRELKTQRAPRIPFDVEVLKSFVATLPFELTKAQRRAAFEIVKDLERDVPMNRLLEGDVGSGKTVVATLAAVSAAHGGFQTTLLAPTELLATQHAQTIQRLVPKKFSVALLTSHAQRLGTKEVSRVTLLKKISSGAVDLVIGTHALLEDDVQFKALGLAVIDEQHRFGVEQRKTLQSKNGEGMTPHLLSMTATPIPRSLALTLYGDLDLSVLDELPKGRRPIETHIVQQGKEAPAFVRLRRELDARRQAFVVCALIDPSDTLGARSVTEVMEELSKGPLKGYRCEVLHGRLAADEKEKRMADLVVGKIQVLVTTTVIEVGVDVPNATVMFVEGAERFGLAQLHQLRGRVGRSDLASICFLHPSHFVPEKTYERLKALVKSQNGFELAEKDLALRGPGEVYGTQQSGFPEFKIADLFNVPLISAARESARTLLEVDPLLAKHLAVLARVSRFVTRVHFE